MTRPYMWIYAFLSLNLQVRVYTKRLTLNCSLLYKNLLSKIENSGFKMYSDRCRGITYSKLCTWVAAMKLTKGCSALCLQLSVNVRHAACNIQFQAIISWVSFQRARVGEYKEIKVGMLSTTASITLHIITQWGVAWEEWREGWRKY